MTKLKFIKTLKYQLNKIGIWNKISGPDFKNKIYVSLHVNETIQKKYELNTKVIDLEYVISRKWISFSPKSTMFDLTEADLLQTAMENELKLINIPKNFDFVNDYIFLVRKLREEDITIIPMDDKILIDTYEQSIQLDNWDLLISPILECNIHHSTL